MQQQNNTARIPATPAVPPFPTFADLVAGPQAVFAGDPLQELLNQPPNAAWVKKHPMAKKKVNGRTTASEYLPIGVVEYLLTAIFPGWWFEVKEVRLILNTPVVTLTLHVNHPATGAELKFDGVGGKSVQVNSGAAPADLPQIKSDAVMMAAPSAVSFALKDAAQHLGPLFGRDLNREDSFLDSAEEEQPQMPAWQQAAQQPAYPQQPTTAFPPQQPSWQQSQQPSWGAPQPQPAGFTPGSFFNNL